MWINKTDILNLPKNAGDNEMYEWLNNSHYFMGIIKIKGKKELDKNGTFVDFFEHPLKI